MTEWFWRSSSFSIIIRGLFWMWAFLFCLLRIWDVCGSPRAIGSCVYLVMRTICRGLCRQKECPSAKCFGLRRKHRLWFMGILCVGRNTSACGRTDLLRSSRGRTFIMQECVCVCVCGCLRVTCTCMRTCVCVSVIESVSPRRSVVYNRGRQI